MLTNSLLTDINPIPALESNPPGGQDGASWRPDRPSYFSNRQSRQNLSARPLHNSDSLGATNQIVEIRPADAVIRRITNWDGMTADIVQSTSHDRYEARFRGPVHLLVVHERGARRDGETFIDGLPPSTLRDFARKLTFVPAGREYRECQEPRTLAHAMYLYFDPAKLQVISDASLADTKFTARLFFEDATLLDTALKLKRSLERPAVENKPYLEALGAVLAHELVRLNSGAPRIEAQLRGGLAAWQQRIVTAHIDEHLGEPVSLSTLAQLARLSPYYFCRAFKQSFGVPPHRYHISRRVERAKTLLAKRAHSVTDIGLTIGYSETSSFTTAFRKATGFTPSVYRRSLG